MERTVSWKMNLAMLWISQLLVMAGFAAMIPFIPLFIQEELHVADEGKLAIYVSMFNFFGTLAYAVFCPIWGKLSDRFGVKPMLLRGTFIAAIFFPMMAYVSHPGWLVLLRFLSAACAGTTAASQIMVARCTPDYRQGFAQGVLTSAYWAGAMLGNVAGGFIIYYFDYLYAFWLCGILYFLAGISILFTRDNPVRAAAPVLKPHSSGPPHLWLPKFTVAVWLLLVLFLITGLVRQFETPYIALKIKELSSAETAAYWTGIVSAVVCVGAILSGIVCGYLADKVAPVKLLVPVMLVSALTVAVQGAAQNLWLFTAARTLMYMVIGAIQPSLQKLLSAVTPARKRGSVFGFASCAISGGGMLAAVFSGWSIVLFQLDGVFYTTAILMAASIPLLVNFLRVVMSQKYYLAHENK